MRKKIFFISLLALGFTSLLQAQPTDDKAQIEKERQQIQKELQQIQTMYNQVKGQTKLTMGQYSLLNKKISLQERYIGSISKELRTIDDDIYRSNLEIYRLQKQLDTLKMQYARTVVYAYKNRSNYDYLNFIFSANGFNDAIRRIAYLKSYRAYREKQVATILETQQLIAQRKQQQLGRKVQKNEALENQSKQVNELAVQKNEKAAALAKLQTQGKDLQAQINAKKKRDRDLNNAIMAIIRREVEAAAVKARAEAKAKADAEAIAKKNASANNTSSSNGNNPSNSTTTVTDVPKTKTVTKDVEYLNLNAKDVALNSNFELNRGKLPWPVDNGFVSIHFGTYNIEGTPLKGDNPGITISTPASGVAVKSVFNGEVVGVFNMGDGMAVTIRHGKYFTTYSNLASVSVSKGATVAMGQSIGRAGAADDGGNGGQIDFLLMIVSKNVNPEPWLRR